MSAGHTHTYTNKLIHILYCVCACENSQMHICIYTHTIQCIMLMYMSYFWGNTYTHIQESA
jgi:hypothetical protein